IAGRFDNVSFSPNVFTPYPGIPIWPQLRAMGLKEPQSLAEWAAIDLGTNNLPWLQNKSYARLQRGISYFLLDNQINSTRRGSRSQAVQSILQAARKPLHWRIRNYFFAWPLELWLSMAKQWLVVRRSLLTGQPLSHQLAKAR
ncbi:MAG TPA: hypothetical protein VK708_00785, partial [Bryobacteraceae bacterium]|nr:hypothetical protein [Bryobacteraceae bacterium]